MNILTHNGSSFVLRDPAGGTVSLAASQTCGLQELLNLCAANGHAGRAFGGGVLAGGYVAPFVLSDTIYMPPMVGPDVEVFGCIRALHMGAKNAVLFDSMDRGRFVHRGILEYSGSASPVKIQPGNAPTPGTPFASIGTNAIQYSEIALGSVINRNPAAAPLAKLVEIDPTYGAINNNDFAFAELNCAAAAHTGIHAIKPNTQSTPNSCFGQNAIRTRLIVGATVAGIVEGDSAFDPAVSPLGTNLWDVLAITTQVPMTYGAIFAGLGTQARIGSISVNGAGNNIAVGVYFGAGSRANRVVVCQNEGATPVVNAGLANNVALGWA